MYFENLWCIYVCPNKLGILSPHEGGLCMSINPGKVCLRRIDPPAFSVSLLGISDGAVGELLCW